MRPLVIAKLLISALAGIASLACEEDAPRPARSERPATVDSAPAVNDAPAAVPATPPSERPWWDREYGVGVVRYAAMERYEAEDVIRAAPSVDSDTVAILRRDSLCFAKDNCVRSYERMIEYDYEIPGWAILAFTPDSTWARVTLAPYDSAGPTGWVAVRRDSVEALLWSRVMWEKPLFFLRPDDIAFYDAPVETARVTRTLVRHPNSDRLNYIMNPLEVRGHWLRVELLTPSPMCEFPEPKVTPDTVWIRYLRTDGRPRVFYYTRGC